jgi:hypothetical protein
MRRQARNLDSATTRALVDAMSRLQFSADEIEAITGAWSELEEMRADDPQVPELLSLLSSADYLARIRAQRLQRGLGDAERFSEAIETRLGNYCRPGAGDG